MCFEYAIYILIGFYSREAFFTLPRVKQSTSKCSIWIRQSYHHKFTSRPNLKGLYVLFMLAIFIRKHIELLMYMLYIGLLRREHFVKHQSMTYCRIRSIATKSI